MWNFLQSTVIYIHSPSITIPSSWSVPSNSLSQNHLLTWRLELPVVQCMDLGFCTTECLSRKIQSNSIARWIGSAALPEGLVFKYCPPRSDIFDSSSRGQESLGATSFLRSLNTGTLCKRDWHTSYHLRPSPAENSSARLIWSQHPFFGWQTHTFQWVFSFFGEFTEISLRIEIALTSQSLIFQKASEADQMGTSTPGEWTIVAILCLAKRKII